MNRSLEPYPNVIPSGDDKRPWWRSSEFYIPAGLIFLGLVPALAGPTRIYELAVGAEITPANARFFAAPIPVIAHIISAILYSILGAFQFAPQFRRNHMRLHRNLGRVLWVSGFVVAVSGLWMTLFYPWPPHYGPAIYVMRLFVSGGMFVSLIAGIVTIRRRQVKQHSGWMIRSYALAMGAGSQVFTHMPLFFIFPDAINETTISLAMGAGWLINIVVAEWIIRRP